MKFLDYIRSVWAVSEDPIEPSVKKLSKDKQRELREQQDLKNNAVRTAVLQEGAGDNPMEGDVVYFHYTVREPDTKAVLASTSTSHGGLGCPHVAAINTGQRIPRGWELVLPDMKPGQRSIVDTNADYGFSATCDMPRPAGVPAGSALETELHLLHIVPARQAKPLAIQPALIKTVLAEASGWQTPRPPNIVTFRWAVAPTAILLSADDDSSQLTEATHTLGSGSLPEGLEFALNSMPPGEVARFVIPVAMLTVKETGQAWVDIAGTTGHTTIHVLLDLQDVEEVRDMTGDGRVLKRKLQDGTGTFPVDAPVQDAAVTIQYSIHHATAEGRPGERVVHAGIEPPALHKKTFTTGEGVMPSGMEMAVKLMLPGERCEVMMQPDFGFSSCTEASAEVPHHEPLVAVMELLGFEREGHPEVMEAAQILEFCLKRKERGNALYAMHKYDHAIKRFDHALQVLKSFRGDQTTEQTEALNTLHISLLGNSAAAFMAKEEYPEAVRRCEAAFELDQSPSNFKVLLRRARASILNGDYEDADDVLKAMKGQAPSDMVAEIDKMLAWSKQKARAARKKQREQFGAF